MCQESSRAKSTDGWKWEEVLWYTMGEKIRTGEWSPANGTLPVSVAQPLQWAHELGIQAQPYIYPTLGFSAVSAGVTHPTETVRDSNSDISSAIKIMTCPDSNIHTNTCSATSIRSRFSNINL